VRTRSNAPANKAEAREERGGDARRVDGGAAVAEQDADDASNALWFKARVDGAPGLRKKMIVALARKLLIALWRMATIGEIPQGVVMRPAA
jgi:hypothetical protein